MGPRLPQPGPCTRASSAPTSKERREANRLVLSRAPGAGRGTPTGPCPGGCVGLPGPGVTGWRWDVSSDRLRSASARAVGERLSGLVTRELSLDGLWDHRGPWRSQRWSLQTSGIPPRPSPSPGARAGAPTAGYAQGQASLGALTAQPGGSPASTLPRSVPPAAPAELSAPAGCALAPPWGSEPRAPQGTSPGTWSRGRGRASDLAEHTQGVETRTWISRVSAQCPVHWTLLPAAPLGSPR